MEIYQFNNLNTSDMEKKAMGWRTKGMNRDLAVSVFSADFTFENKNLRLSTNESNTTMCWVNEKGTKKLNLLIYTEPWKEGTGNTTNSIVGIPIGTAAINHKLVVFTTDSSTNSYRTDRIYVFEVNRGSSLSLTGKLLYRGNLRFSTQYPLETMVSYEAGHIEKVYWTDGFNQPRLINIQATKDKLKLWNHVEQREGEEEEIPHYASTEIDTFFDFVPSVKLEENVTITKQSGGGTFAPGVIQYAITYINKFGQQSNIVYVSPLYYLALEERGASPEEKVNNNFKIVIKNADQNFDFIRIYSIQRTSYNLDVVIKLLEDIPVKGETYTEEFNRKLEYNNNDIYTLPRDTSGKILTAIVTNGAYNVTVASPDLTFSYKDHINIVGYSVRQVGGEDVVQVEKVMSLQEVIDAIFYGRIDQETIYDIHDYHVLFTITQGVDEWLQEECEDKGYDRWALSINNVVYLGNSEDSFVDCSFVYNYKTQEWNVLYSITDESVEEEYTESPVTIDAITYIDNGTTGSTVDPYELLFVGGKEVSILTMVDKDNTLFMGNIVQKNTYVNDIQDYFDTHKADVVFERDSENAINPKKTMRANHNNDIYSHTNQLGLNQRQISTFKGGETYRFGFQLQKYTGEWSEPIYLRDVCNNLYPKTNVFNDFSYLSYAKSIIDCSYFDTSIYKNIRPLVVFPSINDRNILCQGVLNPTVFNVQDRKSKAPFAQASWFFRPIIDSSDSGDGDIIDYGTSYESNTVSAYAEDSYAQLLFSQYGFEYKYVLIADVNSVQEKNMLSRGYITASHQSYYHDSMEPRNNEDINEIVTCPFDGYIYLGDVPLFSTTGHRYVLLSSNKWEEPKDIWSRVIDATTEEGGGFEYRDIHFRGTVDRAFKFYPKMRRSSNGRYYFMSPDEQNIPNWSFIFDVKYLSNNAYVTEYYKITFSSIGQETDSEYIPTINEDKGSPLNCLHYQPIYAESQASTIADSKKVEIQGSVNVINTPFEELTQDKENESNTTFFIDQSIVTLNSPDLEFDADVQTYGTEGFKLRIIGAVPITSSVSAHSIRSSSMLEVGHNDDKATPNRFGIGEMDVAVNYKAGDLNAYKRLVSDVLWNDVVVINNFKASDKEDDKINTAGPVNYMVYPWHRNASLNNDYRAFGSASSWLETKKESTMLCSLNTEYFPSIGINNSYEYEIGMQIPFTENANIVNYRLPKQSSTSPDIDYYANIEKVLYNKNGYEPKATTSDYPATKIVKVYSPISMKYRSTTHAVLALKAPNIGGNEGYIPLLPHINDDCLFKNGVTDDACIPYWESTKTIKFSQDKVDSSNLFKQGNVHKPYGFLWLGEIYKEPLNQFGGNSKEAIRNNTWLIGGDTVSLSDQVDNKVTLYWTTGDTYYQRYDCLKTYASNADDTNQIIEILSFMCETHTNIDGRYDRNRGQADNTWVRPDKFNLWNPVYNQQDNYFQYRKSNDAIEEDYKYPNQIYYSKTKNAGADVDLWTNVTLASVLEIDGDKGEIRKLVRQNDRILSFQDSGISQLLYNENVQIATQQGVPIEIANSGKVHGARYLSDTVGCSNKWSVVSSPSGVYFIDSNNKDIYQLGNQLSNISLSNGFNSWAKNNIPSFTEGWKPENSDDFVSYYDRLNQEVLFINNNNCLAYSEKVGAFTSFYDYSNAPYFCSLDDIELWISKSNAPNAGSTYHIWQHRAGEYCKFFDVNKPYSMTLVANAEGQTDKTFSTIEFRSNVDGYTESTPFDSLEVWNEYQHGISNIAIRDGHTQFMHHTDEDKDTLKRKFRIWRCDIPRDNYPVPENKQEEEKKGIFRSKCKPLNRMRNPWIYFKLEKEAGSSSALNRSEIYDILLTYFI